MDNPFTEGKIEKIEKIGLGKAAETTDTLSSQSRAKFDEALSNADPTRITAEVKAEEAKPVDNRPSIMDIAGKGNTATPTAIPPPTETEVLSQADLTKQKFQNLIDTLSANQDKPVAAPERASMTTSLQHADRYLNQALKAVSGVEAKTAIDQTDRPPLMRFLNFLTEGEKRLDNLIGGLQDFKTTHKELSPEMLLSVQIRLGFVQTELEFFTNVLNKSLESTKTIMNVQI